jgi:sensor c-di-GMP phosphodiesterase-like protein
VLDVLGRDAQAILTLAPDAHLAVNFSSSELTGGDLATTLSQWSARSGVPLSCFVVEATERALIDVEKAAGQFRLLREAGVRIAIDDFGTGYSNLAYLAMLEVDYLKIDRLFVQAMGTSAATNQVAASIVAMARELGLRTITEGVETEAQASQVRTLGCDYAQGYHFARPMPLPELCRWLRDRSAQEVRRAGRCSGN